MSDDQLDNDLKNRIRQVFDHYDDNTAGEGWQLLREKYPEEERNPFVGWLWRVSGIAAILVAGLGIGLWINYHPVKAPKPALSIKKNTSSDTAAVKIALIAKNKPQLIAVRPNSSYQKPVNTSQTIAGIKPLIPAVKHQVNPAIAGIKPINLPIIKQQVNPASMVYIAPANPVDSSTKTSIAYKLTNKVSMPTIIDSAATVMANKTQPNPVVATVKPAENSQSIMTDKHTDKSIQSLFDQDDKYNTAQNAEEPKIKVKKVTFSVYAATYVSYAKGSSNQFNTGAGITSDIKLTPNLSISTGVAIAQNSLSYNNTSTLNSSQTFPAAASYNFGNSLGIPSPIVPSSKNLNASLVGLNVPVDLKYVFDPEKGNTYIAAGLSSGTFINETYNYTYNYGASYNPAVQQSQDASSTRSRAFDNFYFASMLDVSFGMGYHLGSNQFIIEPFLKYPLSGLGDQHILFGSGGINLKFDLDPTKKKR